MHSRLAYLLHGGYLDMACLVLIITQGHPEHIRTCCAADVLARKGALCRLGRGPIAGDYVT
jgi:hypothetical protein